jgi:hypothetical protein
MSNVDPLTNHGTLLFAEALTKDLNLQVSKSVSSPSLKGGEWCGLQKHRPFPCTFQNAFDKPLSTACHVFDGDSVSRKNSKNFRTHRKSFRPPYPMTAAPASLAVLDATLAHLRAAEAAAIAGVSPLPPADRPRPNQGELDRRPAWNRQLNLKFFSYFFLRLNHILSNTHVFV